MGLTLNANNYFWATLQSVDSLTTPAIINQDYILINKYQSVYPITLTHIYTLTM